MKKRSMKKRIILIPLAIMMIGLLAGCGSDNASSEVAKKTDEVIVVMGTTSEPEGGFDPATGWGAGEHVHEPLIQSTLTVTTPELGIGYDLATDIKTSEDGMMWTVTIRDDVMFTDGTPLTASDVAFTYNTLRDSSSVNDFTMLKEARAESDETVVFEMTKPYSIWPYTMAITGIVPEHAYDEDYGDNPVGSGRYILKQWDKGQQVILEANPDYYGEAVAMKKVTILFMDEDAAFAAVKSGQADIAYTAASYSDQTVTGYQIFAAKSVDNRGINLPAIPFDGEKGNDITSDIAVRKAMNIGIDREALIDQVLNGYGAPAYSVCDTMPWYNEASEASYNQDEAKSILDEGGWIVGTDKIREKNGKRASLTLLYPSGDSLRQALAAAVSNQLREIGIEVKTEGVGWDVAYDRAQSEMMTWGWGAHTPMELYNIYHTAENGLAEYSPYASEAVDQYMDEALAAGSLEESYELWKNAQLKDDVGTIADVPWVWLVNIDHLYWADENLVVAEQKLHPHGHGWSIVNNVDKWSWKS